MLSSKNRIIAGILLLALLVGLIVLLTVSQKPTSLKSSASGVDNLNTSSQISSTTNTDKTTGPKDSSGNYSAKLPKEQTGTLTFSITDPFPTALPSPSDSNSASSIKSFLIRVKKIEIYSKSGHWETLTMPLPTSVDLASLNSSGVANLGETILSAEEYLEVRIYIDKASLTLSDGKKQDLSIKNGTEVVRLVKDFSVDKGKNTNLIVDFNASKSYTSNIFSPFVANFIVSH